ncbi:MAG: type II toxin-antitoxin system Phd/YefM family antitoxin [Alphaproteobacteria bacterium]|nr:type II toxin-antitoxin system Phd/YefM family antitoxin [Alphaproteobacteria bacterium]
MTQRRTATEARAQLPSLLRAAEQGQATIITRDDKPIAALVPISALDITRPQQSLVPLAGSGRGLWTRNSRRALRRLRGEWDRL